MRPAERGIVSDIYLRPTAFVDAPFGFDGQVARLAGGMLWFSAVEVLSRDGPARLVPVGSVDALLAEHPSAKPIWQRLIAPRPPLELGKRTLRFDQPAVMGILNVTPDSFSDGGAHADPQAAAKAGVRHGGSRRRGGGHRRRVDPPPVPSRYGRRTKSAASSRCWSGFRKPASSPRLTRARAASMRAALSKGACIVNDVSGLTHDEASLETVAAAGAPVVIMHARGDPLTMQDAPRYDDVLLDIYDWLEAQVDRAVEGGVARERIIADPGIGFGKTVRHNLELLNGLSLFHGLGVPPAARDQPQGVHRRTVERSACRPPARRLHCADDRRPCAGCAALPRARRRGERAGGACLARPSRRRAKPDRIGRSGRTALRWRQACLNSAGAPQIGAAAPLPLPLPPRCCSWVRLSSIHARSCHLLPFPDPQAVAATKTLADTLLFAFAEAVRGGFDRHRGTACLLGAGGGLRRAGSSRRGEDRGRHGAVCRLPATRQTQLDQCADDRRQLRRGRRAARVDERRQRQASSAGFARTGGSLPLSHLGRPGKSAADAGHRPLRRNRGG